MTATRATRIGLALTLAVLLVGGLVIALYSAPVKKTTLTAYFENSNGIYPGDDVRILGVPVGTVRSRLHHAKRALRAAIEADARPNQEGHVA